MPKKESTSLHLHFTSHALAYAIFDPAQNLYTYFSVHKNLQSQIEWDSAFSNDPYLRINYTESKASFTNSLFAIIPNDFYIVSEEMAYLNFNIQDPNQYFKSSKPIVELGAEVLFCVERDPKIILNKYYPNCTVYHSSIPLLEGILRRADPDESEQIFIFSWNNHDMEIIALKNGKLALYNHFFLSTAEEFLYFPLYVCERLGLNLNLVKAYMGGNQSYSSKESNNLKAYFKNFSFLGLPPEYGYKDSLTLFGNIGLMGSLAYLNLCE